MPPISVQIKLLSNGLNESQWLKKKVLEREAPTMSVMNVLCGYVPFGEKSEDPLDIYE